MKENIAKYVAFAPEYRFIDLDFVIFLHLIVIVNIVKQKKRKYRPVPITQYIERNSDILRFHFLNSVKFQLIHSIENDLLCFFLQIKVRNTHTHKHITRANIIDPIKCCSLAIASISPSSSHSNNKKKRKMASKVNEPNEYKKAHMVN